MVLVRAGRHRFWKILCAVFGIFFALLLWTAAAEPGAHWSPDYEKADLSGILSKETLGSGDYHALFLQTGLSPFSIDTLRLQSGAAPILQAQEDFFMTPEITCTPNTPISAEEHTPHGARLAVLEDGDILITPCSHTFGWRNGHAALVVDAAQGLVLEAAVLGENSAVQPIGKWETYPAVLVFRLRGVSAEERAALASAACQRLCNVPYGLLCRKRCGGVPRSTHCAHLVWDAFYACGFDLDSNGGSVVTPHDLAASPLLELKQVYGIDPRTLS